MEAEEKLILKLIIDTLRREELLTECIAEQALKNAYEAIEEKKEFLPKTA